MIRKYTVIILLPLLVSSCAFYRERGTIAELKNIKIEIADADVEGGLEKAMQGYQKFLEDSPESELTPEAIRRLADLKIEREYGIVADAEKSEPGGNVETPSPLPSIASSALAPDVIVSPVHAPQLQDRKAGSDTSDSVLRTFSPGEETDNEFERRATRALPISAGRDVGEAGSSQVEAGADLKNAGAEEAIKLYRKLLEKYPMYERNDQVLYQLSRAYEETGRVDQAMLVMNRLVDEYPESRYIDEVQFRRGEYYFTRKKYLDAEDAYGEVLNFGVGSVYYERALYKKGWTFYKQELYEEALHQFLSLLDYKVASGYDLEHIEDEIEGKRVSDTFRVVSLAFSNLGGANSVQEYFSRYNPRPYEDIVYKNLAEFYFTKRRYSDAAGTYNAFVESNPYHEKSPHYSMRVIDIYMKGGFPRLVIDAKKEFVSSYGISAEYWRHFDHAEYPEVVGYVKTNLIDLANHYHSLYQNENHRKDKPANFSEASHWYRQYLDNFPRDEQSPGINYQLADLLLENKDYGRAAEEYERSAYDYPVNEKSEKAAYAAVYAYRQQLKVAASSRVEQVKQEILRTSLRLVDTFPRHEKATLVLGALIDDLFEVHDYVLSIKLGRRLVKEYPDADTGIRRGAWLVIAHSSYEIEQYHDAELAYIETLELTAKGDEERKKLVDNLAASIYKQGEKARAQQDYETAVSHFLRIADLAPTSDIRPSAEYDAAAVLIQIMDLKKAIDILVSFRKNYPGHDLQKDVTKKIAFAYMELGEHLEAAKEYERVAKGDEDQDLIREAMYTAAELYEKAEDMENALRVYEQYVGKYPRPLELALETYYKIAMLHKSSGDMMDYRNALKHIVEAEGNAGAESTERTRYLAAQASLVMVEPEYEEYLEIRLVKPFKTSLSMKQKRMKALVQRYTELADYQVADVTAASTYYIAEIYYNFSRSLLGSERPDNLDPRELEEFNLMVEEQAYPFEEKAIAIHERNVSRLANGIYSSWIDRSIEKLADLVPARYGKPEESVSFVTELDAYVYTSPGHTSDESNTPQITNQENFRDRPQIQEDIQQNGGDDADNNLQIEAVSEPEQGLSAPREKETALRDASVENRSDDPASGAEETEDESAQTVQSPGYAKTGIENETSGTNESEDVVRATVEAPSSDVARDAEGMEQQVNEGTQVSENAETASVQLRDGGEKSEDDDGSSAGNTPSEAE